MGSPLLVQIWIKHTSLYGTHELIEHAIIKSSYTAAPYKAARLQQAAECPIVTLAAGIASHTTESQVPSHAERPPLQMPNWYQPLTPRQVARRAEQLRTQAELVPPAGLLAQECFGLQGPHSEQLPSEAVLNLPYQYQAFKRSAVAASGVLAP